MSHSSNFVVKKYPLDLAQTLASNKIVDEQHDLDSNYFPVVIPLEGSFFNTETSFRLDGNLLKLGIDYQLDALNYEATEQSAKSVYDAIVFRRNLKGKLSISYHVIGEPWVNRVSQIQRLYNLYLGDSRPVMWDNITGKPDGFPCLDHHHYGWDIKDWGALTIAVLNNTQALIKLHTGYETRIEELMNNAINENKVQLNALVTQININSGRINALTDKVTDLNSEVKQVAADFYAEDWVPDTRRINGYPLEQDIILSYRDVGAISSRFKDTFIYGFNDELTNIGKTDNTPARYFNNIGDFMNLPVGYHGYVGSNGAVGFPSGLGWLHKVGNGDPGGRLLYMFYEDNIPSRTWYTIVYRHELGLYWRKGSSGGAPGEVKAWFSHYPPENHVFLHGQPFDPNTNPELLKIFPNASLPDLRGMFLRGLDGGRGIDCEPNRDMGSFQHDRTQEVWGTFAVTLQSLQQNFAEGAFYDTGYGGPGDSGWQYDQETRRYGFNNNRIARTGPEETVKNIAVNWIIMLG